MTTPGFPPGSNLLEGSSRSRCRGWPTGGPGTVLLLLAAMLVVACTNSKLIVSPLYNRLDNTLRSQFEDLADFDTAQLAAADQLIGTFHVWHRQSELPAYARLLDDLQATLREPGAADATLLSHWFDTAEQLGNQVRSCHPINFAGPLIGSMSDEQISAMHRSVLEERAEDRQRYNKRTPDERRARRLDRFATWASRIGVTLQEDQRALVRAALIRQISLRQEYFAASDRWINELFSVLRHRDEPDFGTRYRQQLRGFGLWLKRDHPQQWQHNRTLWQETALKLEQSLTRSQRLAASNWLAKMADTLTAIAADRPSFKPSGQAQDGCQPEGSERSRDGTKGV